MIDTYKFVHGLYDVSQPHLELAPTVKGTRSNGKKLKPHRTNGNLRLNFFSERVVNTWNKLPSSVVFAPSVNSFKNRLDEHWTDHPIKFEPSYRY